MVLPSQISQMRGEGVGDAAKVLFPKCRGCGAWCWFPRVNCPSCASSAFSWQPVGGLGTVISAVSVVRGVPKKMLAGGPYEIVGLRLDEGIAFVTRSGRAMGSARRARLVWLPVNGMLWPCAEPIS
ncbi:hypothetical protein GI374_13495 [Paracoccus sp. S-4012]|nr:hypothetical protein [Paracoccus sp. S-4012]